MLVTYASFIVSVLIVYAIYYACQGPNNCKAKHPMFLLCPFPFSSSFSTFRSFAVTIVTMFTLNSQRGGCVESKCGKVSLSRLRARYGKTTNCRFLRTSKDEDITPENRKFNVDLFQSFLNHFTICIQHNHMLVIAK